MKLELNTDTRTIILKEKVNIGKLLDEMDSLGLVWEEWDIDEGSIININPTPITLPEPKPYSPHDPYPWIIPNQPYTPYSPTNPLQPIWITPQEPTIWCTVCQTNG